MEEHIETTEKKKWITPVIILIEKSTVHSGSINSYVENMPTPFGGTGSGAS